MLRLAPCLLFLFFAACATHEPVTDDVKSVIWEQNKLKLEQVQSWDLKARIAIQIGKEGGSASLNWKQSGEQYLIEIVPPFGRGAFQLNGSREGVTMQGAGDKVLHAKDPETLLQAQLGWQVPISGLIYWIRGLPDPALEIKNLILSEQGLLQELSQGHWQISYSSYTQAKNLGLPRKLVMQNEKLRVKLVIKQWDISS